MGEIEKIITDQIQATSAKADGLMKALFGKSFEETGEMIADQVRLRRFKNQVKIFEKAKEFLKGEKLDPQKVNLKVLAPLLEFSSYEEDEELQERWAYLIKNIVSKPFSVPLQQHVVEILNKISNEEVKLLDYLYDKLNKEHKKYMERYENNVLKKYYEVKYPVDKYSYRIRIISEELKIDKTELELLISNLVALGTMRYETEVDVNSAYTRERDSDDNDVDIDINVTDSSAIRLTRLGYVFIEMCTE